MSWQSHIKELYNIAINPQLTKYIPLFNELGQILNNGFNINCYKFKGEVGQQIYQIIEHFQTPNNYDYNSIDYCQLKISRAWEVVKTVFILLLCKS